MYYLPVPPASSDPKALKPNHWTKEFVKYLQDDNLKKMVDTNSGSWRICFVVDKITCFDEDSDYNYEYKSDRKIKNIYR